MGMTVVIAKAGAAPDSLVHPPFLNPLTTAGEFAGDHHLAGDEPYRWESGIAPDRSLSILVSRADGATDTFRISDIFQPAAPNTIFHRGIP
jgi:hypothetical protein